MAFAGGLGARLRLLGTGSAGEALPAAVELFSESNTRFLCEVAPAKAAAFESRLAEAPALRLGWVVCPPAWTAAVAREKALADRGSPGLDQLALAELIRSGRYDRHLRRMRTVYAARREALATALAEHAPAVRVGGLAAGIHAVLHLPPGADEQTVVAAAAERSVGLYGMSRWRRDGATEPAQLVLGFGNVPASAVRRGIERVADLLAAQPGRTIPDS